LYLDMFLGLVPVYGVTHMRTKSPQGKFALHSICKRGPNVVER
jgi:hypothetical protein